MQHKRSQRQSADLWRATRVCALAQRDTYVDFEGRKVACAVLCAETGCLVPEPLLLTQRVEVGTAGDPTMQQLQSLSEHHFRSAWADCAAATRARVEEAIT
jgi:hypothetical protein